jgi:hypothetical protein
MKARVLSSLVLLAVTLAGCNVFFVARQGRWNPNDPENEQMRGSTVLTPELDGFVHGEYPGYYVTHSRVFADTALQYDYYHDGTNGGYCYTLIGFDFAVLPRVALLENATLTLTFDMVGPNTDPIDFQRIAEPWDSRDIELEQADSPSFVAGVPASVPMPLAPGPLSVDITGIVRDWLSGSPNYGLRVRAWTGGSSGYEVRSFASEAGGQGPRLALTYQGIPE